MEETAQKPACIFVGQMPSVTQYPLFQVIRVSAYLKHPDIMVCFQKKGIQILKIFDNILIIFTKIRRDPYGAVSTFHAVANRLCRIVGDAKRIDGQIFDMKSFILPNLMKDPLRKFSQGSALQHCIYRPFRRIDRKSVSARDHSKSLDVIRMLMGDQDPVQVASGKVNAVKPCLHLLPADPDIHQHMCLLRSYVNTISAAAACNTAKSHNALIPSSI